MSHRPRCFLLALVSAISAEAGAQSPQPLEAPGASTNLPAHIERIAVRDTVERDGRIHRVFEADILLRDAVGVSQFGQIGGTYAEGLGEVLFDRVVILKPDGRRIDVTNSKVEDLNPFGMTAGPIPADVRFRRLTIPGLEPGDRLSYRMTVREKPLIPNVPFGEFKFIVGPVAGVQIYELDHPAGLHLNVRRRPDVGAEWEQVQAGSDRFVRRMTLRQPIPLPQKDTDDAETLIEPDVIFSGFRSWEDVGRWWWLLAKDRFQPDAAVRTEADRLATGLPDARKRIEAFHGFVSGQVRYLNVGFGTGRYEPRPASEVLVSRYGDCKGKHALLAALATASGIEVLPAMVHSARKALHDDVPGPSQFDHLISVLPVGEDPKEWLWIDTTNDITLLGHLSRNLRGKRALVMGPTIRIATIPERTPFKRTALVETEGRIDPAGPIRARVRWTLRDDAEPQLRAAIRVTPRDKWNELGKQLLAKEWSKGEVSDLKAGDPLDLQRPLWVEYAVEHTMTAKTLEKDWTFWVPLPEVTLPQLKKDPKPGEPVAELNFPDETVFRARFEMPEGMKASAPLSVALDRPFASFRSTYGVTGRTLTVERVLLVKQLHVMPDQASAYEAFREGLKADRAQEFPIVAFRGTNGAALETADALNEAGDDALEDGDAKRAEELLRKAVEKEAKHKAAWNNLGRALRQQGKTDEALKAFTRQIEIDPYDKYAYGNRGALLAFDLGRTEEGEKELAKQIEVAPFEPDAYRDLAWVKRNQRRYAEQAEILERGVAAKPSDRDLWFQLAWARARTGKGDVAAAAEKATALEAAPRGTIILARALAASGNAEGAAQIVRLALPMLIEELKSSDAAGEEASKGHDPLFLGEGWRLIGAAALQSGDLASAERYLTAAWEIASNGDVAVDLAALRERQGRESDGAAVVQQAAFFSEPEDNPARRKIQATNKDASKLKELMEDGNHAMARRHIQQLPGPAPQSMDVRLLLTVDAKGRVIAVRPSDPKDESRLRPVRARILGASVVAANPDNASFKLVRGGALSCFSQAGCHLGVDLLGDKVRNVLER